MYRTTCRKQNGIMGGRSLHFISHELTSASHTLMKQTASSSLSLRLMIEILTIHTSIRNICGFDGESLCFCNSNIKKTFQSPHLTLPSLPASNPDLGATSDINRAALGCVGVTFLLLIRDLITNTHILMPLNKRKYGKFWIVSQSPMSASLIERLSRPLVGFPSFPLSTETN